MSIYTEVNRSETKWELDRDNHYTASWNKPVHVSVIGYRCANNECGNGKDEEHEWKITIYTQNDTSPLQVR